MHPALRRHGRKFLPRGIRPHRILAGPLKGHRLVTSWHDYPGALLGRTERPLLEWFASNVKPGETWLDVGAQYGYTAIALARLVGPAGRVVAFEPVIETAGHLHRTGVLNGLVQLSVVPLALGDAAELTQTRMKITRGMAAPAAAQSADSIDLLSIGFDHLWPSLAGSDGKVHGVKIDVQGLEGAVLKGMAGMLRRDRPKLVVELHRGVNRDECLALVASLEYQVPGLTLDGHPAVRYDDDESYVFEPAREPMAGS